MKSKRFASQLRTPSRVDRDTVGYRPDSPPAARCLHAPFQVVTYGATTQLKRAAGPTPGCVRRDKVGAAVLVFLSFSW